jgi:hypothetical protein
MCSSYAPLPLATQVRIARENVAASIPVAEDISNDEFLHNLLVQSGALFLCRWSSVG